MSEFKSSSFRNEDNSGAPDIVGVSTFTSPFYFVPPSGTTAERPSGDGLAPGMLRFNTDIGRLEVWRGDHWAMILGESPNLGVNGALGARGLFASGFVTPTPVFTASNVIDYITISTLGNASDFGDLQTITRGVGACASSTRGLFGGGGEPGINVIDFVTISSTGNGSDFGDLTQARAYSYGCSSQTRGLFSGGQTGTNTSTTVNTIDYVTIASNGVNAQDFGDLQNPVQAPGACASSTRGIIAGGEGPGDVKRNVIEFVTISTTANATDFGDLIAAISNMGACSNSTRGVFGGATPGPSNVIQFITIASTGNTTDFGDLIAAKNSLSACASSTRGVFAGGQTPSPTSNVIEYITILTTGNSIDFGDLTQARAQLGGLSNAHGGL
jgi:hypothetical protein